MKNDSFKTSARLLLVFGMLQGCHTANQETPLSSQQNIESVRSDLKMPAEDQKVLTDYLYPGGCWAKSDFGLHGAATAGDKTAEMHIITFKDDCGTLANKICQQKQSGKKLSKAEEKSVNSTARMTIVSSSVQQNQGGTLSFMLPSNWSSTNSQPIGNLSGSSPLRTGSQFWAIWDGAFNFKVKDYMIKASNSQSDITLTAQPTCGPDKKVTITFDRFTRYKTPDGTERSITTSSRPVSVIQL